MKKYGFRFVLCLMAVLSTLCLFVLPGKADATVVASGACGDTMMWTLDNTGILTISGEGQMYSWNNTGSDAPWYGKDIKTILIGGSVESISDYAFYNCDNVTEISLGTNIVKESDDNAVVEFDSLVEMVTIPITIGRAAFLGCDSLTRVFIPTRVTEIGAAAFAGCTNLSGILVDADHEVYASDTSGVMYTKDMTKLLQAPGALSGSFTVPNGVADIGQYAFYGCTGLSDLILGTDVTKIGFGAFDLCAVLRNVNYTGTQAQWNEIEIASGNTSLLEAQLCCMYGKNGWVSDGGKWYYYENGAKAAGWRQIGGIWYYFNASGVMLTSWQQISGKWYYFASSGAMQTGWLQLNGTWYYLESSGAMLTGTAFADGVLCKFNVSGAWQGYLSGWHQIGGKWYYTDGNGKPATGWKAIGGTYYYFGNAGVMQTGWLKEGNTWYYLKSSGAMATGWAQIGGKWYCFNAGGAMQTGWKQIDRVWYYFHSSGAMATGWNRIGGVRYYFDGSGCMKTGWQKIGGTWYYFNTSGAMQTGWLYQGGVWYYFHSSGAMATGPVMIGSVIYQFNSSGACLNP